VARYQRFKHNPPAFATNDAWLLVEHAWSLGQIADRCAALLLLAGRNVYLDLLVDSILSFFSIYLFLSCKPHQA